MRKHLGLCGSPICRKCCESEEEYNELVKKYLEWLKGDKLAKI